MPAHPLPPVEESQEEENEYREGLRADFADRGFSSADIEIIMSHLEENPITPVRRQWKEKIMPQIVRIGIAVLRIQNDYDNYNLTRQEAKEKFANIFLEKSQGGVDVPSQERMEIIKIVYSEMQNCVKEIRRKLSIPLNRNRRTEWPPECTEEEFLETIPDILAIFDKSELPILNERITIRETCLKIMKKRMPRFSIHGLKRIIYKK